MTLHVPDTIDGVLSFLESIPKFGNTGASAANFSLDRILKFCDLMDHPQNKFPSIHVAGTNGKGTTCQMLASVYQHAGYKTALYTSPHLIRVQERFRINGVEIDNNSILEFFKEFGNDVTGHSLTYFEITTALAFWYFARENVDIAIIETGLGGRLDATNVINPEVSVITSIGMDHADILGNSITGIAREKAGIIKKGKPVVAGLLTGEAKSVVIEMAHSKESEIFFAGDSEPEFKNGTISFITERGKISLNGNGRKRIDAVNTTMVFLIVSLLDRRLPVPVEKFIEGIEQTDNIYPHHAHFEKLVTDREWYFDGAHNAEATNILIDELLSRAPAHEWKVVLSYMKDKLTKEVATQWKDFPNIYIYAQSGIRAAGEEDMSRFLPGAVPFKGPETLIKPVSNESKSELVIFSGSFYFYEKVRRWMGTMATPKE
jgi:dihydrofolate synthase / folylpolyglutamate synthase